MGITLKGVVTCIRHFGPEQAKTAALCAAETAGGIGLEICPGSNVVLGVFQKWASHPIDVLRRAGCKVTVSTDDPPFFHTTMRDEYRNLANTFGWDHDVFTQIARTSAEAAFCDEATRTDIISQLEAAQ